MKPASTLEYRIESEQYDMSASAYKRQDSEDTEYWIKSGISVLPLGSLEELTHLIEILEATRDAAKEQDKQEGAQYYRG